ncbi:hypothetical protein [Floricoccus penangensis]|uniref:hypothetical protein n=1 Tax=Floricoccus penangensis TaxID=1859475 RepID=UPI00203C4635|nr:hypothetical protein [Floricoccus penangensis]URZ88417.1 hypothetical protein KIW23_05140 [Floricoccus penangensis]
MKTRKKLIVYLLLLPLYFTTLSSCTNSKPKMEVSGFKDSKYNFAIFAENKRISFNLRNEKLEKLEEIKPFDKKYHFENESFSKLDNFSFTRTIDGWRVDTYLAKIGQDLSVKLEKPENFDVSSMTTSDKYFYLATKDSIYQYDENFKIINTAKNSSELSSMKIIDGKLYGLAPLFENNELIHYELVVFDESLKKIDEIKLEKLDENSTYMDMVFYKDNIYITETYNEKDSSGKPNPGNKILVYNLKTAEQSSIELKYPYPNQIYIDEINENLIIQNLEYYVPEDVWTVYSLKDGSQHQIELAKYRLPKEELSAPFFTQKDGLYYFLMSDSILQVDGKDMKEHSYSFKDFDIKSPYALLLEN